MVHVTDSWCKRKGQEIEQEKGWKVEDDLLWKSFSGSTACPWKRHLEQQTPKDRAAVAAGQPPGPLQPQSPKSRGEWNSRVTEMVSECCKNNFRERMSAGSRLRRF